MWTVLKALKEVAELVTALLGLTLTVRQLLPKKRKTTQHGRSPNPQKRRGR